MAPLQPPGGLRRAAVQSLTKTDYFGGLVTLVGWLRSNAADFENRLRLGSIEWGGSNKEARGVPTCPKPVGNLQHQRGEASGTTPLCLSGTNRCSPRGLGEAFSRFKDVRLLVIHNSVATRC